MERIKNPGSADEYERALKHNLILLWIRDTFIMMSTAICSISVLSAFFMNGGMSAAYINFYISFTQIVNLAFSLLHSSLKKKNGIAPKACSLLCAVSGALTLLFSVFCIVKTNPPVFISAMLITGGALSAVGAHRNVYEYKLPCEVIKLSEYSTYISYKGIFGGIAGVIPGIILGFAYDRFDFMTVSCYIFLASALFLFLASVLNNMLVLINPEILKENDVEVKAARPNVKKSGALKTLFKNNDFRILFIPNFMRGFGDGLISMISVIAVGGIGLTQQQLPYIASITSVASVFSCFIYSKLSKKIPANRCILLGGCVFSLIIVSLLGGVSSFFVVYFIAYTGYNIVCCAIPDIIYQKIDSNIISAFHVWRLVLTNLGTVVFTSLSGIIYNVVSPNIIIASGSVSLLICCVAYFRYYS